MAQDFRESFRMSERRACRLAGLWRSTWQYRSRRREPEGLRRRLKELAAERPRFGYPRLHVLLRREGRVFNRKRIYRIYREEKLQLRRKRRKRVASAPRRAMPVPDRVAKPRPLGRELFQPPAQSLWLARTGNPDGPTSPKPLNGQGL